MGLKVYQTLSEPKDSINYSGLVISDDIFIGLVHNFD